MGRGCTDAPCLLVLAGAATLLAYTCEFALRSGEPRDLVRAADVSYDVCGADNSVAARGLPLRTSVTHKPPGADLPLRARLPAWLGGGDWSEASVEEPVLRGGRDQRARPLLYFVVPPGATAHAPGGIGVCVPRCPTAADVRADADALDADGLARSWACVEAEAPRCALTANATGLARANARRRRKYEAAGGADAHADPYADAVACGAPAPVALRRCAAADAPCASVCAPVYATVPLLGAYCLPTDANAAHAALERARAYDEALDAGREPDDDDDDDGGGGVHARLANGTRAANASAADAAAEGGAAAAADEGAGGVGAVTAARRAWRAVDTRLGESARGANAIADDPLRSLMALVLGDAPAGGASAEGPSRALLAWGLALMLWADVLASRDVLGAAAAGVVGLAALWLLLMRHFAALIVWLPIALLQAGLLACTYYMHFYLFPPLQHGAYGTGGAAVLLLLSTLWLRGRIQSAVVVLRDASAAIGAIPSLCLEPVLTTAGCVSVLGYGAYVLAHLLAAGERQLTRGAPAYYYDDALVGLMAGHALCVLWLYTFVAHVGRCVVSGAVAEWYFNGAPPQPYAPPGHYARAPADEHARHAPAPALARAVTDSPSAASNASTAHGEEAADADGADAAAARAGGALGRRGGGAKPRRAPSAGGALRAGGGSLGSSLVPPLPARLPVLHSMWLVTRYHLGTVAFGSLLIALVRAVRLTLFAAYQRLRAASRVHSCCTSLVDFVCCCVACCLGCFERVLELVTTHAYVQVMLGGKSFMAAAATASSVLKGHALRLSVLSVVLAYVTLLARIVIAGGAVVCTWYVLRTYEPYASSLTYGCAGPCVLVGVGGYLLAGLVLGLYAKTVDALFQCAAIDADSAAALSLFGTRFRERARAKPEALMAFVHGPSAHAADAGSRHAAAPVTPAEAADAHPPAHLARRGTSALSADGGAADAEPPRRGFLQMLPGSRRERATPAAPRA